MKKITDVVINYNEDGKLISIVYTPKDMPSSGHVKYIENDEERIMNISEAITNVKKKLGIDPSIMGIVPIYGLEVIIEQDNDIYVITSDNCVKKYDISSREFLSSGIDLNELI